MTQSSNVYQLVFVGKPRTQLGATLVKKGLLKMCAGNKVQAQSLFKKSPTVIFRSESKANVQRMLSHVWRCGWHTHIMRNGKCVYSTEQVEGSAKLNSAGTQAKALVQRVDSKASAVKPKMRRLTNAEADFSLDVPLDWEVYENLNAGATLQAGCTERQAFLIVIKQYKHTFGAVFPLKDYANATCQAALGWVTDAKMTRKPGYLSSGKYYLAEMEGRVGDAAVKYQITIHETAKVFYALYAWTALDNFLQVNRELKQIAASVKAAAPTPLTKATPA